MAPVFLRHGKSTGNKVSRMKVLIRLNCLILFFFLISICKTIKFYNDGLELIERK